MSANQGVPILTESVVLTAAAENARWVDIAAGAVPAAAARGDGPTQCRGDAGDAVAVCTIGTALATAGAAIENGALLQVGDAGKLIPKAAGVAVAKARQTADADGDELEVFVMPN